jgi:hypothetical protein
VAPGLPKHVYLAVHKALEKKPERRFSSVSAFAAALREPTAELEATGDVSADGATIAVPAAAIRPGRGGTGTTPPTPVPAARSGAISTAKTVVQGPATPVTPAPRPSAAARAALKSKRPMLLAIGALLLVGGGVGGYLASRTGSSETQAPSNQPAQQAGGAPAQAAVQPLAGGAPAATPTAPAPSPGHVTVTGLPAGATVSVDGRRQRGSEFDLPPGQHDVRIEAAGYAPFTAPVTVEAGVRTSVVYTGQRVARAQPTAPSGGAPAAAPSTTQPQAPAPVAAPAAGTQTAVLRIAIQPPADLTINSVSKGQQARIVDTLPPGTHLLHFERDGYIPVDTAVTLKAGGVVTLAIKLVPRP